MTRTTYHQILVERLDGDQPQAFPPDHTVYGTDWEPAQAARQIDLDTRISHAYDGALRVHVGIETFDFPAGLRAAAAEDHRRRMEIFERLRKHTKAQLCRMLREGGHVWSKYPPEKWTKEEVINDLIDQELRRAP